MGSRYFARAKGSFASGTIFIEITEDDRKFSHHKDGTIKEGAAFGQGYNRSKLETALSFVASGSWIEISLDEAAFKLKCSSGSSYSDIPQTTVEAW